MLRSFIDNEDAVNVEIGAVLSLVVLMIFTGGIVSVFYSYSDSSSIQASRIGFTDLGSQIARDITNIYILSDNSRNNITLNITHDIPLTIGGRGYSIEITNSSKTNKTASLHIKDGSFFSYPVTTTLNSINIKDVNSSIVYSGSGKITIRLTKINDKKELWIE